MGYFAQTWPSAPELAFPEHTEREREILTLLAQHRTNPEIAARLSLSERTVRNYVSNNVSKLQVNDRVQAILHARNVGFG